MDACRMSSSAPPPRPPPALPCPGLWRDGVREAHACRQCTQCRQCTRTSGLAGVCARARQDEAPRSGGVSVRVAAASDDGRAAVRPRVDALAAAHGARRAGRERKVGLLLRGAGCNATKTHIVRRAGRQAGSERQHVSMRVWCSEGWRQASLCGRPGKHGSSMCVSAACMQEPSIPINQPCPYTHECSQRRPWDAMCTTHAGRQVGRHHTCMDACMHSLNVTSRTKLSMSTSRVTSSPYACACASRRRATTRVLAA